MSSSTDNNVAEYDITLHQGATWSRLFEFFTDTAKTVPWDMTGYTFAAQIRPKSGSTTLTETFTIANTDLVNGQITISITDEETAVLTPFRQRWDLLATDSSGVTTKLIEGQVELKGSITVN